MFFLRDCTDPHNLMSADTHSIDTNSHITRLQVPARQTGNSRVVGVGCRVVVCISNHPLDKKIDKRICYITEIFTSPLISYGGRPLMSSTALDIDSSAALFTTSQYSLAMYTVQRR